MGASIKVNPLHKTPANASIREGKMYAASPSQYDMKKVMIDE